MDFTFDEDQQLFQQTLRDFLERECTPEHVRACWARGASHDPGLWRKLAELGVPGLLVPEAHEGLGRDETDAVLLFEEAGRAALPEPVVESAVAARLLAEQPDAELRARWCKALAVGEALVTAGHPELPFVVDADVADLLLLPAGDALFAVEQRAVRATRQPANDPSRRLFTVAFDAADASEVARGAAAAALLGAALDRGALACAAQQLGVAAKLVDLAVRYAGQRIQFGKPIGSFQAVKHLLADVVVALEYARPVVHRAAWSVARGAVDRPVHVSHAKLAACQAAGHAARVALQVHGAIGYTWEQDVHLWMRRAWSLEQAWGGGAFHRSRVEAAVLAAGARLGPGETFTDRLTRDTREGES